MKPPLADRLIPLKSNHEWCVSCNAQGYDFKTNALIVLCLTIVLWYIKHWRVKRKYARYIDKIPGPPGLPLIGNTIELYVDHDELYRRLIGMRLLWGRHDGINKAWLGQNPYIFISKACTVEPILNSTRHTDKSSDYKFLQPWLGTGLLTSSGKKWHVRRKILTPTFHFKILEDFVEIFSEQTDILVRKLSQEIGGDRVNIFPYVTLCTLDIICETAMGRSVFAQNDSDSNYVRAVYKVGDIIQSRQTTLWYHPDILFRLSTLYQEHRESIRVLHDFSNKVISERRTEIECSNKHEACKEHRRRLAFLDLLLEISQDGVVLTNEDIREEVDTFMFEGHDTISSAVSWTLYLLGCHPEIQDQVVRELKEIFDKDDKHRHATLQDLRRMTYLENCIKESLRLYPSVPFTGRKVGEDIQIGKYFVPAGTTAIVIVPMLHRDPEVFPDPEIFNPDRFLPVNSIGRHPYAYIPFSAGPRNCIGQKFALLEGKAIISGILRRYKIEAAERRDDIRITAELVTRTKNGLHVKILPRT